MVALEVGEHGGPHRLVGYQGAIADDFSSRALQARQDDRVRRFHDGVELLHVLKGLQTVVGQVEDAHEVGAAGVRCVVERERGAHGLSSGVGDGRRV